MNNRKEIEAYKTIGEAAEELNIPQHVIRFWETKFSVLRPKKVNNRRYFSKHQLEILSKIKDLLYNQGFTIAGAIAFLKQERTIKSVVNNPTSASVIGGVGELQEIKNKLQNLQSKILLWADC